MKAKRKTTRKGMTLIEVLIALVIFGMLSSVMVSIGLSIDKTLRATTNLNERVADEAPLMETLNTAQTVMEASESEVTISLGGSSQTVLFEQYSAGAEDPDGDGVFTAIPETVTDINGGAHLRFFNIDLRNINVGP